MARNSTERVTVLKHQSIGVAELVEFPARTDAAVAPEAREEIKELLQSGRARMIIDLTRVRFIDSSGLSVLVTAHKAVASANGEVVLLGPTPEVRSLLELTRLHRLFRVFETVESAVAGLAVKSASA